ncbi:MAG TPA: tRNA (adenosine(37)-N6)-dimethylallyltransferase MiaA [Pedobacter sp.]|uniref:tRNA (adenosine(37)-N6)-dimethylallyltransferase MiaA n=1 Tax=Pedobacter sp. TaxID=1411316 RepID=UPI002C0CD98A|nr:tRNA (adenosine(37)-N6)-dimethylallyltransferase MiaA [Pedobacter sp.]HMI04794.1 tRNA (adenosine(37)-N6)-dimethylallyltransferase MiaA [Pedobacter sp.]
MIQNPLLVLLGATASGKTRLAVRLAHALNGEIISADSRQVFRGMDIGTGKDLGEYNFNGRHIPHHLIDIKEAGERYNVNAFKEDFYRAFELISNKGALPVLCGGTGMYVHSILQNHEYTTIPVDDALRNSLLTWDIGSLKHKLGTYPDEFTAHADLSSHKRLIRAIEIAEYLGQHKLEVVHRPVIEPFVAGLTADVEYRRSRVIKRLNDRLKEGLIDEVRGLLDAGVPGEMLSFYGLEYKFVTAYILGELSYNDLNERLAVAICQFAKRQMTFFRKMEKDGVKINWFDVEDGSIDLFDRVLASFFEWFKKNN